MVGPVGTGVAEDDVDEVEAKLEDLEELERLDVLVR